VKETKGTEETMLTIMDERLAFKAWRRALNASRKEVIKLMDKAGYRTTVWTKRDKGRTIMQVYIPNADALLLLQRTIKRINLKWAARMVRPGSKLSFDVGKRDAVCYGDGGAVVPGMGTLYTLMHTSPDQIDNNGRYIPYWEKK
jgi:hypothetical protein